jgi:2-amino-4-hydroxy-6-hydroxymethyldihydropteridine diphosphokinase
LTPAAIAFGANLGDREATLAEAVRRLGALGRLVAVSPVYRSAPMYLESQPEFLNGVAMIDSELPPRAILAGLKQIERDLGRRHRQRNGPRELDLDLILYGALAYRFGGELRVPHPRARGRRFVLQPLVDVWPDACLPGLGAAKALLDDPRVREQRVEMVSLRLL